MNMKNTIKSIVLSLLTVAMASGQDAFRSEFGYYGQRISGGQVGAADAPYIKLSSGVGTFQNFSIVGDIELVNDSSGDQLHLSLGTKLNTTIGDIDTRIVAHKIEGSDFTFELAGQYDISSALTGDFVDATLSLSLENGSNAIDRSTRVIYTPALNVSKTFTSSYFDLILSGEVGKSYGLKESFEYIQLYARLETVINETALVYVQFNWLDNDDVVYGSNTFALSENFDKSIHAGVLFKF